MDRKLVCVTVVVLALQIIGAAPVICPNDPNCVCGGTLAIELNCDIDGRTVEINLLPNTYINIKCENATSLDYSKLPKCANRTNTFKSVSFKDCPLPSTSFKEVLTNMGVSKTMTLIFQNTKNLSGYFDRKHFSGLQNLTKLLLSINGVSRLPDNLFMDINRLTWLNIRSNTINMSEELFKPLARLETLEISHNHMTNISSNLFSHLSYLRKLSLWQSNVTWFSKDLFTGVNVLEELDLSSNGLNELPSSIFKPLRKLKKLTLFSNKFSSLPQNLFKHNEKLETVVILNNDVKLVELPKYLFGGMANLKQIYIQRSGLEKLPYDVFGDSPKITSISLAYNDLQTLPELIFNDQINLLELDLSHNKLNSLEPKLFSSLVRLENLDLNHNLLTKISGSTFLAQLSLINLNMEHNNLKTLSSHLFSNNKQRMSISLAYNELNFEDKEMKNNSWVVKSTSPFAQTYNLRLLNLSHNNFKATFKDWWINGHDNLDISNNLIQNLWPEVKIVIKSIRPNCNEKPIKRVWISQNPICKCRNYEVIDYFSNNFKTQFMDIQQIECSFWVRWGCDMMIVVYMLIIVTILHLIISLIRYIYRKRIYKLFKKKLHTLNLLKTELRERKDKDLLLEPIDKTAALIYFDVEGNVMMLIKYDARDSNFVYKEMMPRLMKYGRSQIRLPPKTYPTIKESILNWLKHRFGRNRQKVIVIVVFTPNYLMSHYSHVDIKKIQTKMSSQINSVFVFVDLALHNSVYAFLKDQRNKRNSVDWSEPNYLKKISKMTDIKIIALTHSYARNVIKVISNGTIEYYYNSDIDHSGKRDFNQITLTPIQKKCIRNAAFEV